MRGMERAFKKLKKKFPGRDVSVELHYKSWSDIPNYYAYAGGMGSTISELHSTPDSAVDSVIKRKEEMAKLDKEEKAL